MIGGHEQVRPLLAARADELTGVQARWVADHLAECEACSVEAATYGRLFRGLAAMAGVEVEPPVGLLDRLLATVARRRHGTLMMAAAGSAGALVAGVVVARAIQQRRRTAVLRLAKPAKPVTAILAPIGSDGAKVGARIGRVGRWWRLRPA
jgi:predicted anti-sigma-YlaC factor YlaD